jgi:hypothetical protein
MLTGCGGEYYPNYSYVSNSVMTDNDVILPSVVGSRYVLHAILISMGAAIGDTCTTYGIKFWFWWWNC